MCAAVFGLLALVLASVGVYGTVSYSVAQRTTEIGIRVALGARGATIARLVVRQGLTIAAAGVTIGIGLTTLVTQLLSKLLYGVAPHAAAEITCLESPVACSKRKFFQS